MTEQFDSKKTLEIIERLKLARIGEYGKWKTIIKKIESGQQLDEIERSYFSNFTRIYKEGKVKVRSKIYHMKLSENDKKPSCKECGEESLFYCNVNDAYFCSSHVVGHDENEA
ncbi:hypothetical protein C6988_08170 [Nitrosopumilus sp. b1]|uniref:hypothetical protein n=1 Tax=Nitrosopumilus sp. b1 TaxID=2109907 RepID=UPI0015F50307|nr:hypothetical protein [Nitrosopumilus sp. b1]KAF6242661.1 hypothetical protein C6988_08170 [Nitrosopumilus sp. b1]